MEELISAPSVSQVHLSPKMTKKELKTYKTTKGYTVEELNQKKQTVLCFLKPLTYPTNRSAVNELLVLSLELSSLQQISLVFIFSERANTVLMILQKYNLAEKINFIADPNLKMHDAFQVTKKFNKFTESNERNTHVYYLKSNEIKNHIQFGRELPIDEIKSFITLDTSTKKRRKRTTKEVDFIQNSHYPYLNLAPKSPSAFTAIKSLFCSPRRSSSTNSSFGALSSEMFDMDDISDSSTNTSRNSMSFIKKPFKTHLSDSKQSSERSPFNWKRKNSGSVDLGITRPNSQKSLTSPRDFQNNRANSIVDSLFSSPKSPLKWGSSDERRNSNFFKLSKTSFKTKETSESTTKLVTLLDVLENDKFRIYFKQFAESEYSKENVLFWEDAQEFKKIEDLAERMGEAHRIFKSYLTIDSEYEINVSSKLESSVKENLFLNLLNDECPNDLFDSIIFELEMTNLNDTFSRFKFTTLYHENVKDQL
eukprot:gene3310-5751_t